MDEAKIKKLAAVLFDPAAKEGERTNAVAKITSLAKKDRDQLVEALVSGLNGNADKKRSADDGWELSRLKLEVSHLKLEVSSPKWELSSLKMRVSMLTAELNSARSSRDYVMGERDRLLREIDRTKAERDRLQAELDRMKAERRREQQRPANLPEVKSAAPGCANTFRPRRRNHKTCSDACRKSLSRTQPSIQ